VLIQTRGQHDSSVPADFQPIGTFDKYHLSVQLPKQYMSHNLSQTVT